MKIGNFGFRPSKAKSWPVCRAVRAPRIRCGGCVAYPVMSCQCGMLTDLHFSWPSPYPPSIPLLSLQTRLGSQSDALAIQSIRSVRGNSLCVDCDTPSEYPPVHPVHHAFSNVCPSSLLPRLCRHQRLAYQTSPSIPIREGRPSYGSRVCLIVHLLIYFLSCFFIFQIRTGPA